MDNTHELTLNDLVSKGVKLTPMMAQYHSIKIQYPDTLLLFRLGDFYEVFFEDARTVSKTLNIALTHRGKLGDVPIPMAGIPHHAAVNYIDKLTTAGLRAAICEQIEDPKDAVGIVKRQVVQIVSPGIPFDLGKASATNRHFITTAFEHLKNYFQVSLDFTTGEFEASSHDKIEDLVEKIRSISPREFIQYLGQWEQSAPMSSFLQESRTTLVTHISQDFFNWQTGKNYIPKLVPGIARDTILQKNEGLLSALSALSYYISSTQSIEQFHHIRPLKINDNSKQMRINVATLIGLEILPRHPENYQNSLLGFFDRCQTVMGPRKLRTLFENPTQDLKLITARQNIIETLMQNPVMIDELKKELNGIRDLERIMAKIATNKGQAGDLLNLATGIVHGNGLIDICQRLPASELPRPSAEELADLTKLSTMIGEAINDEIGASIDKGNLIRSGYSAERDHLANLRTNVAEELIRLENRYREETGITKIKIRSNNINGFFIEVSNAQAEKVPSHFKRRQTLVNAERYTTEELSNFEKEVLLSKDRLEKLEQDIFKNIISEVLAKSIAIQKLIQFIALADLYQSIAKVSLSENLKRPTLSTDKKIIHVEGAFHPLIKNCIKDAFIPHNLHLDHKRFFGLITGPNMAGKTTVMREIAIIQFLAQVGLFVPATIATLGVCDQLFSRLGASDDIVRGQSTFMVEMTEASIILRHATERSLIILDELGRGTSTYDGLSIAWAIMEHIIKEIGALTLFATHYHELIEVTAALDQAKNLTVETISKGGQVSFLYRLIEEGASQSFGIFVGKMAGLPNAVIKRSNQILKDLETSQHQKILSEQDPQQLTIFEPIEKITHSKIHDEITQLNINDLRPIEALNLIAGWQKQLLSKIDL